MSKSKISEKHSLNIEGILDILDEKILINIDEIGEKCLSNLLTKFNGENVKISISFNTELE